jgi:hypothetical protein
MRVPPAGLPFPYPKQLAEIAATASALSQDMTFIRVDLYVWEGRIYIGELTSFPTNCTVPFRPREADLTIAALFDDPSLPIEPSAFADGAGAPGSRGSARIIPFRGRRSPPERAPAPESQTARVVAAAGDTC